MQNGLKPHDREASACSEDGLIAGRGQGYHPRFRRQCTDRGCLVLLVAFCLGMWYLYSQARAEGNLAKLTHGFDWKGEICGVDESVVDKPFLFWCTASDGELGENFALLDGICVETCPGGAEFYMCPGPAVPFEVDRYMTADHGAQEVIIGMRRNLTMKQSYPSVEALGYCFPHQNVVLLQRVMERTHVSSLAKQVILAGQGAAESWRFLIIVAIACIIIGYVFLFVIWHSFDKLIYGLVVGAHLLLLAASVAFLYVGFYQEHNFFRTYFSAAVSRYCAWSCSGIVFFVWVLFCILCCNGSDAIAVTIDSVRATCEVIGELKTMLLQPLLHSGVVVSLLLALVYGLAWILSTGKVVPQGSPLEQNGIQIAGLHRSLEFSNSQWAGISFWIFGLVWLFETVNALGQFAISHAVVAYTVYEEDECCPMLSGYFTGIVFHLGTLAFGGFIIGCLKIIAALLAFLVRQTRDEYGIQGTVTQVLCCCCMCTFACIEKILEMVNDLVYTDVALRSSGYLEAADNVVRVAAASPMTYASIKASATGMRVLGVTTIGCGGTFLSYQVLSSSTFHRELDSVFENSSSMLVTSNILGTTIASGFICFYVALAFMMVFYQTTYSLMYCMLLGTGPLGGSGGESQRSLSPVRMAKT
eukprot:TRINITY_DN62831_c0_g1_i1.p1 TRINITY_DN62831_c0_g1~~TRINITY_DN62831_c0_g1_i1.p1  ORF type:complete len:670 (+),score=81.98 TRINITY_DN62831_c0_g1_i1:81-2012(+)